MMQTVRCGKTGRVSQGRHGEAWIGGLVPLSYH